MYNLFTFHNTHAAIYMEKAAMENNIGIKIIPVPRAISASCGLAARINAEDYTAVKSIAKGSEIEIEKAYIMDDKGNFEEII